MASAPLSLLLLSIFLLHQSLCSVATILPRFRPELFLHPTAFNDTPPTVYFEVTRPIELPRTKPCSYRVLQHDFGYTYGKPPVLANYTPPTHCPADHFAKIVLEWKATCKGRQYDRIFGVWLGGVELLRSCTAEPRATGIVWKVEKDITRYYSLLMKNQTLAVYLGNLVTRTYTGVYHVNITIHFYPAEKKSQNSGQYSENNSLSGNGPPADLILPISRNLPLKAGLWFEIENSTDTETKEFQIPQNVYRAVLEVYVSFHENDEFWYTNFPNDYIAANNLSGYPGNGPFREVVVSLDGEVVGAVWPFTVIYTGGVNPLLWRPITGIGSFNLPTYDIHITPFLGNILDGKTHRFGFSVTNALNVWYIDANLHLWLDHGSAKTEAELLQHSVPPLILSAVSNFTGFNGTFLTSASRFISSGGWVKSSFGNFTTYSTQDLNYSNWMVMGDHGNMQIVNQTIHFDDQVYSKGPYSHSLSFTSNKTFPIYLYTNNLAGSNDSFLAVTNITLGFYENKSAGLGFAASSLNNLQNAQGYMVVKDNLVVSGLGSTQEVYRYDDSSLCYFRNVSSSNYTVLYDKSSNRCGKKTDLGTTLGLKRRWYSPARRVFLDPDLH